MQKEDELSHNTKKVFKLRNIVSYHFVDTIKEVFHLNSPSDNSDYGEIKKACVKFGIEILVKKCSFSYFTIKKLEKYNTK